MAVPKSHVFAKGRPSNPHEAVTNILRYVPKARTPWHPSRFGRENIMPDDLKAFWNMGRGRTGPAFPNSGYSTNKTTPYEENQVPLIPKAELEKYMPDIHLGPKALVTPVSMMSVRAGHRVTHDLIHSYDPYIGANEKHAVVNHDNITPQDPDRVGLHPATIHCRGRIYRWLRRGPFFQDDHYFRRNIAPDGVYDGPTVTPDDVRLAKKVIRIANKGHLKAASEEYRKFVSVPPVQVYRALTKACIGQGKIADAVAIFEDGDSRLFYVSRDAEVLLNVMKTAIVARNRSRVLWVYNIARGRFYENHLARVEIDSLSLYELSRLALEFFADNGCVEEARTIYDFMRGDETIHQHTYTADHHKQLFVTSEAKSMVDYDLFKQVGLRLREALAKGEAIPAYSPVLGAELAASKNVAPIADIVTKVLLQKEMSSNNFNNSSTSGAPSSAIPKRDNETPLQYLSRRFNDVDVPFVLRHARTLQGGQVDLLQQPKEGNVSEAQLRGFSERAIAWLTALSRANSKIAEDIPMPYLKKSKPSAVNANVRVTFATTDNGGKNRRLAPNEQGYKFHFGVYNRYVNESYQQVGASIVSQVLALQPTHTPSSPTADFNKEAAVAANTNNDRLLAAATSPRNAQGAAKLLAYDAKALAERRATRSLHPSIINRYVAKDAVVKAMQQQQGAGGGAHQPAAANNTFSAVSSSTTAAAGSAGGAPSRGVDAAAAAARLREVAPDADFI